MYKVEYTEPIPMCEIHCFNHIYIPVKVREAFFESKQAAEEFVSSWTSKGEVFTARVDQERWSIKVKSNEVI
uniref:Uncharacterized protein n=1 Tax=Siphoviridae sp. ctZHD14 TaxID=2827891 RepID=A0A8S5SXA4_9CAUD|nr:MAG TPA: hypothetical protein [Siphoviridae sp. ctZHD14]